MATGNQNDLLGRLKALLPRWFSDSSVLLAATLQGYAWAGAFAYSLYAYAKQQTRIATATDGWLDMIAADYFGSALVRISGQSDGSFRSRIMANLLRERATHDGMVKALTALTGRTPYVVELRRPIDTTAYGAQLVQRAGPATYYGPDGSLRTAQPNVLRWTCDPANLSAPPTMLVEAAATNLLKSSGNLIGPAWTRNAVGVASNNKIIPDTSAAFHYLSQSVAVTPGQTYTLWADVLPAGLNWCALGVTGATVAYFDVTNCVMGSIIGLTASIRRLADGSCRCKVSYTNPTDVAVFVYLLGAAASGASNFIGDGVNGVRFLRAQFESGGETSYIPTPPIFVSRASTATYYDVAGTLQTAAANAARMTYDPVNLANPPYLMVEGAATNYVQKSVDFTGCDLGTGGAISPNTVLAPDGTLTASAYTHPGSTGNFAYLSQTAGAGAADASQAWTLSMWVKIPSGTANISLAISNRTISTRGSANQTVNTSWQHLFFSMQPGQLANTGTMGIGIFGTNGQVYHVWGAQLELGTSMTSYIPTSAGPVTRAADVVSYGSQTRAADILLATQPNAGIGGYGVRGAYGSVWPVPYQAFVTAFRPLAGSGYEATDADIYATIDGAKPVGTVVWAAISN